MRHRAPIFAALAAVVLAVGFYFLLWQPKDEELETVQAETAELESERSSLQNELRRLEEIAEREVEYRAALAKLEEYIPSGPAQSTVIREFQATADAAGVTIESVAFADPVVSDTEEPLPTGTPDTVLASIAVTMNIEGGYFQLVDFFRRLEVDVPRAVLMQHVAMHEGQDGFPVLANNWSGVLYTVVPDPEVVGAPPPEEGQPEADADAEAGGEDAEDEDENAEDVEVDVEIQAREEEQS